MTTQRSTQDLIAHLATRPAPAPFRPAATLAGMLVMLALGLGLFWLVLGIRTDLGDAWAQIPVRAKTVLPALLSLVAVGLALRSARPAGRVPLWPLALPVALALTLVLGRLATADGPWLVEAVGQTALACLTAITLLSTLPLAAGICLLRRAAPTQPALTGALLGLAAGGGVAAGYALHCTEDSPLFFVCWYGLAIGLTCGVGAWMGNRFLRW